MASPRAFQGYEKIVDAPEQWGLDEADYRALRKVPWVVTEKIHGANFCLITDGHDVRCAKRKELLPDGEDFFGHLALLPRLTAAVLDVHAQVQRAHPEMARVAIYGELFGGGYPHPDVAPVADVQPVQTGIYYSPRIEFCAFDLAVETTDDPPRNSYLDYDEAMPIFEAAGLLYARPLLIGAYEEALAFPLGFESHVPAQLGLPPLPTGNRAEGVVVKPLRDVALDGAAERFRPILKRKIPEFAEDKRYRGATKWEPSRDRPGEWRPALADLRQHASDLVTDARLASAISKVGRLTAADPPRVQAVTELLVEDIAAQLQLDLGASWASVSASDRAALDAHVRGEVRDLIALYLAIDAE